MARVFGVIHSSVYHKPYMQETRPKNLLICRRNTNVKRAVQSDLNRPNEIFAVHRRLAVHHDDTIEVEGHTSGIEYHIYLHIVNYNYNFLEKWKRHISDQKILYIDIFIEE